MRSADPAELKALLLSLRAHTLTLFDAWERAEKLLIPFHQEFNPPLWELGHIGWFQEYWLGRNQQLYRGVHCDSDHLRKPSLCPQADSLYNSSLVPHDTRWDLPLLAPENCREYLAQTLKQSTAILNDAASDREALYFFWLAAQHEAMHLEAGVYMAQAQDVPIRGSWLRRFDRGYQSQTNATLNRQSWLLGSANENFCFDNELGQHEVNLDPFEIDLNPVNWDQYMAFVTTTKRDMPRYVREDSQSFAVKYFGNWYPMNMQASAVHISWFDAHDYCRWANRRFATEAEWECAAMTLPNFNWGDVWEWTADEFQPYPGFTSHPYKDYSFPWFGSRKVLRGACFATHPCVRHVKYRNFFAPERTDIFSGFRTCAID